MTERRSKYGVRLRSELVGEYEALLRAQGMNQKNAHHQALLLAYPKRAYDGRLFASEWECERWQQLVAREQAGEITDLQCQQPRYKLVVCGKVIATYTPDSSYTLVATGERVVEDAKSKATANNDLFKRNLKHVKAQYGVDIHIEEAPKPERKRRTSMPVANRRRRGSR